MLPTTESVLKTCMYSLGNTTQGHKLPNKWSCGKITFFFGVT